MKTEQDLRHALATQAEDAASWPAPQLRSRGPSRARRALVPVLVGVGAIVLTLVAVPTLVTQHDPAATTTQRPSPGSSLTATPGTTPGPQDWVATRCAKGDSTGCAIPSALTWGSLKLVSKNAAGPSRTLHPPLRTRVLPVLLNGYLQQPGTHYLLIAARGEARLAHLQLKVGDGRWIDLPTGRPSLVKLVTARAAQPLSVRDAAAGRHPAKLSIQGYVVDE